MSYVLAVDPGGTVGYALYPLSQGASWSKGSAFWSDAVQPGQAPTAEFLDWARGAVAPDWLVVCERFTITSNTSKLSPGGTHDTLDCIGVLRYLCRWSGARFELQTPSQAKNFVTDAQLRELGLWVKSKDHARDAIRHLVFALVQHGSGAIREDLMNRMAG